MGSYCLVFGDTLCKIYSIRHLIQLSLGYVHPLKRYDKEVKGTREKMQIMGNASEKGGVFFLLEQKIGRKLKKSTFASVFSSCFSLFQQ